MTSAEIRAHIAALKPIADEARTDAQALVKSRRERAIAVGLAPNTYATFAAAEADHHAKNALSRELFAAIDELERNLRAADLVAADAARMDRMRAAEQHMRDDPVTIVIGAARAMNRGDVQCPREVIEQFLRPAGLVTTGTQGRQYDVPDRAALEMWARTNFVILTDLRLMNEALRTAGKSAAIANGRPPYREPGNQRTTSRVA